MRNRTRTCARYFLWLLIAASISSQAGFAKDAQLAPNAPKDKPVNINSDSQLQRLQAAIAPYVKKAKATLPQAKSRFLKGLKPGEIFFVTTTISEGSVQNERVEQIFVRVKSWKGTTIDGTIDSQLHMKTYKMGDKITVNEKNVSDWLIAKPDGSEEGNVVGKFLDTYKP